MTRGQGLEIIEKLFMYENPYIYNRVKFFFIAADGTYVNYLDDSTEEVRQHLLSFLETNQGRTEVRNDVISHINAQDIYERSHLIWDNRYHLRFEPEFDIYDRSNEPKGWQNLNFINRIFCFEDDLASYELKTAAEKQQFISDVLAVIHETYSFHEESQKLHSQALRLLIGPIDFFGKGWSLTPEDAADIFLTMIYEARDARSEAPVPVPDIYQIGIKANAFSPDPSNPGKYLLTGSMQTAFRTWFDALEKEGYDYSNLPTYSMIRNKFVSENNHPESSIETALKKVRLERNGKY
jgi:hypothetical protein